MRRRTYLAVLSATGLAGCSMGTDGTTTDTPTSTPTPTSEAGAVSLEDGGVYFVGQTLTRTDGIEADATLDLLFGGEFVTVLPADGEGVLTVDTDGRSAGAYTIQTESGDEIASFKLIEQKLQLSFDADSVANEGSDTGATLSITSNRNDYDLDLTASVGGSPIDGSTLHGMIGSGSQVDADDDGTTDTVRLSQSSSDSLSLTFAGLSTGTFSLTAAVTDTTATASASITVVASGEQWTTFQQNTSRTGAVSDAVGPQSNVTVSWQFELESFAYGSPVTQGGTVYVGDDSDTVFALDSSDGTKLWQQSLDGDIRSAPTVADGTVHVATKAGSLHALDPETGQQEWEFTTSGGIRNNPSALPSPAVVDGTVYHIDPEGTVYAVEEGSETWQFDADGKVYSSPAVADGVVYVASKSGTAYALDTGDGSESWTASLPAESDSTFTVANGIAYVGTEDSVEAFDASDGSSEWTFETDIAFVTSSPAVDEDRLFVGSSRGLHCLDAISGTELWQSSATDDSVYASPAVAGDIVYAGTSEGFVYGIDTEDGSEHWSYDTGGSGIYKDATASPAVADGTVYTAALTGQSSNHVFAFEGDSA